jgi:hypothetical protein
MEMERLADYRLSPAERGLELFQAFFLGPTPPGFMLTPAPQASVANP